jgi:predicted LPLAT superfamily acyltransferase
MKEARTTARIIADVKPEVKEKLIGLSDITGHSMTQILTTLIEAMHNELQK